MSFPLLSLAIHEEQDIVAARQRARALAQLLGFELQDQTRIATAVSEIGRNAYAYAGGGKIEFILEGATPPQVFLARISDHGPGIVNLRAIMDGEYRSRTGMGLGIIGARRLMDQFDITSKPGRGTTVILKKMLPRSARLIGSAEVTRIAEELARGLPRSLLDEVQAQNRELLQALDELRKRQEELVLLNRELEDTNRGVVALYAELDEKADHLRRADELKSRFLSNMSHEFRTPVNSIMALSGLLSEHADGELTAEQEKQVGYIYKAAAQLSELVSDLLDLAKVEAGKIVVRPTEFQVPDLFGALRGMLRPLFVNDAVDLAFDHPADLPPMLTDESKVSQILRNFISNALKFTERGEVRVTARYDALGEAMVFAVADTGIGIGAEDQQRIFEEFTQIENPLQKHVKGTGLGLPLTKKLAELLGGSVSVQSQPGRGSIFSAVIPLVYGPELGMETSDETWTADPLRHPVLVVEDSLEAILTYQKLLHGSGFQVLPCRSLRDARLALQRVRPEVIILDILLRGEDSWDFLARLKAEDATRDIPIVVISTVPDQRKSLALGADAHATKPVDRTWLIETLQHLTAHEVLKRILVIDDDEVSRYLARESFSNSHLVVSEAENGLEGLRRARQEQPDLIVLDLVMPGMSGFDLIDQLKTDPATGHIPVVVLTSKLLSSSERDRLLEKAAAVVSKEAGSRERALAAVQAALDQAPLAAVS